MDTLVHRWGACGGNARVSFRLLYQIRWHADVDVACLSVDDVTAVEECQQRIGIKPPDNEIARRKVLSVWGCQ